MAKLRSVNTHFWEDGYISTLTPDQKLLFLYFLTCPLCNIAGVYECTVRRMVFDTGLTDGAVNKALLKFHNDGKIRRALDYIILVNHHKNQKLNPSMEMAVKAIIKALPEYVRTVYTEALKGLPVITEQPADSVMQPVTETEPTKTLAARAEAFHAEVFTMDNAQKYGKPMLLAFYQYWSEPTRSGSRMRMELQPTWKLGGRLATWASREVKGKPQGGGRIYREE